MGAEHSQQRTEPEGREVFESDLKLATAAAASTSGSRKVLPSSNVKRRSIILQNSASSSSNSRGQRIEIASPTVSEQSRPPSPPLSVCSDLPYVSYTDRPIGDSPKIRNKPHGALQSSTSRAATRRSHPSGTKPKRPQSIASSHNIVIVKPGGRDFDSDPELAQLRSIPQFLPVLRSSITSATFTRDPEILERLNNQHLLSICNRMQTHMNLCATQIAKDQSHLVERTKVVSNHITTLFATFVDQQKTYAAYAEQFSKIRAISEQVNRCNTLLHENIASMEEINNFLDVEDRLEPFIWRTDDNRLRGQAEGREAVPSIGNVGVRMGNVGGNVRNNNSVNGGGAVSRTKR